MQVDGGGRVASAAEQTIADFAAAFPQTPLACRVLYDQPEAELVRRIRKPLSQQAARVE